ncbi:hypothetical protein GCM10023323_24230 [Streptomyces thinghirensis]|uniref:Tr-type G domain-containing protein n=1 Tax=Streptomyces thinghirensis TaxID=551547 RepID=A0ABP9T455_9ACTN
MRWQLDPSRSRAVLIGTSNFAEPARWPRLPAVESNIEDLRRTLTHPRLWGLAQEHCTTFLNATDAGAVAEVISTAAMEAEDTLLVYYAGHGATTDNELLLTLSSTTSLNISFRTLSYNVVKNIVRQRRAQHAVILLDCCFSGMAHSMGDVPSFLHQQMSMTSAFVFTSSARDSVSLSPPGERHTAFTGELIKVLEKGIPDAPAWLSLGSITRTVTEGLRNRRMPVPLHSQTGLADQLALARNVWSPVAAQRPQPTRSSTPLRDHASGMARVHPAPVEPLPGQPRPDAGRTPAVAKKRPSIPRSRPVRPGTPVSIATLGHLGHGKTTLTAAITKVLHTEYPRLNKTATPFASIEDPPGERRRGTPLSLANVEYQTEARRYAHLDCPSHADYIKNMTAGAMRMDAAILVVAATDGPMPQTRDQVRLARQVGVPYIVVAVNKADMVQDEEILELVELEVRELLEEYEFPGDDVPVVKVSALKALEGDKAWGNSVLELMKAVDEAILYPPARRSRQVEGSRRWPPMQKARLGNPSRAPA